jgi:chaperonin cofactor prefoldin
MLTDKEFRHYQELYNDDPVVQRLCKMNYQDEIEPDLEERVAELEDEVSDLEYEKSSLEDQLYDLEKENQRLKEKIQVWETLEKK